jgi:hypothetical protein
MYSVLDRTNFKIFWRDNFKGGGGRVGGKKQVHQKLEESTRRNSTKIVGNLLLTGTKVSPFGEKISKGESTGADLEIGVLNFW